MSVAAQASGTGALEFSPRAAGFLRDVASVAGRALRAIPREPEGFVPALIIPLFFFVVNVGALSEVSQFVGIADFNAFQLPVAIVFAVTGVSRAPALVNDIRSGYFDRLLITPVNRWALLLGLMLADFALVIALSIPVIVLGLLLGVDFVTGPLGIAAFVLLAGLWGLVFTGFPYAIALRTGNAAAVASSFILFFPFAFLTTTFLPQEALTGWLATVADFNPVTYLLAGLRSITSEGWVLEDILAAVAAVGVVGIASQALAFGALRARVRRE